MKYFTIFAIICFFYCCGAQQYDGVVRLTEPGRYDAYLVPPFISNHASFIEYIEETNSLIIAWFSGIGEGKSGVAIVTSLLSNVSNIPTSTLRWPNATVISQRIGYSNQNPVLFCNNSLDIYVFHTQQPAIGGEVNSTYYTLQSTDGGKTFSTPTELFSQNGIWDRNRVVLSLNGSWIIPMYYSVPGTDSSFIFTKDVYLPANVNTSFANYSLPLSDNLIQPTIVRPFPGKPFLRVYYRDENQQSIYTATSSDDGKSWTDAVPTVLPNNNSGISAFALLSGNIALIYNPTNSGRNILVISLSLDNGLTWKFTRQLENQTSGEFSYPSLLQTSDGVIHISYTYLRETVKYTRITEDWISGN